MPWPVVRLLNQRAVVSPTNSTSAAFRKRNVVNDEPAVVSIVSALRVFTKAVAPPLEMIVFTIPGIGGPRV